LPAGSQSDTYASLFLGWISVRWPQGKNRRISAPVSEQPMKLPDVRLGRAIREAREERGFTQEELALRCGISLRHLISIEHGANFSVALLIAIAAELGEIAPMLADVVTNDAGGQAVRVPTSATETTFLR
jgi:DNA-binding XRE family transcriptional regulator